MHDRRGLWCMVKHSTWNSIELCFMYLLQWRSQNTADARAQRGHTTFAPYPGPAQLKPMPGHSVGTLPRPRPALSRLQYRMQKQLGRSGGCSPRKFWNFIGRFRGYFRPYRGLELEHFDHAFATNLRARSVRSL